MLSNLTVTIESDGVTQSGGVLFVETPEDDRIVLLFSDSAGYFHFLQQLVEKGNAHFGTEVFLGNAEQLAGVS